MHPAKTITSAPVLMGLGCAVNSLATLIVGSTSLVTSRTVASGAARPPLHSHRSREPGKPTWPDPLQQPQLSPSLLSFPTHWRENYPPSLESRPRHQLRTTRFGQLTTSQPHPSYLPPTSRMLLAIGTTTSSILSGRSLRVNFSTTRSPSISGCSTLKSWPARKSRNSAAAVAFGR